MSKNITLAVDEDVLDRVRLVAAGRKTTVNAMVRDFLQKTAFEEDRLAETRRRLRELMDKSEARIGPGYVWNREEIYEDRMFPRREHPDLRGDGKKR